MLALAFNGLDADFLLVRTTERARRMGVGLASRDVVEGGAAKEPLSDGVSGAGEKSIRTRADSLSVAEATRRKSPAHEYSPSTGSG
jgi:hypothetical protein